WTVLGSAIWNSVLVGAGYLLGDRWCSMLGVLGAVEDVVIGVFILVLLFLLVRWVRNLMVRTGDRR
ncbi:MAG: hypothetical protein L0H91_04735, partial [Bifidobacterium mongoliense]|nr:hypothetical protein [Bifidobacterium mongoliense]